MSALKLRPYQATAVERVEAAWRRGVRRPAVVLPTGAGKTVIFAWLIALWLAANPGRRALVLAHRRELVAQAAAKLHAVAPDLRTGIVMGDSNQTLGDVIVASVQTLDSPRRIRQLLNVGLVVVDECHHATAASYVSVLRHFGCLRTDAGASLGRERGAQRSDGASEPALCVGFTATMTRGDDDALGDIWQEVVFTKDIASMIVPDAQTGERYLCRPRGKRVRVDDLDLSGVRRSRGDYSEGALGRALTDSLAPEAIAKAYVEHAPDRPGLSFAPTVESARVIGEALGEAGISSALVHGGTPAEERRQALADYSAGKVQVLSNCMVLTEGTDLPLTSCIVVARPTTNLGLYIQMVGRGLRQHPGKLDCLVLDVVGASQRHALMSPIELMGESLELDDEQGKLEPGDGSAEDLDEGELTLDALGGSMDDDILGANGPLVAEDVDLFHGSANAWLRTHAGVWFLPAGERYIAMLPGREPSTWDVVWMHAERVGQCGWVIRGVPDQSYAMAWAEDAVTAAERNIAQRDSGWRARKPSPSQSGLAARLGLHVVPGMMSGEVSNAITTIKASRRIDPRTPAYARGR